MTYNVGDVLFFDNDSFFSWATEVYHVLQYGKSCCTHVGIISEVRKDTVVVHEAIAKGFVATTYMKSELNKRMSNSTLFKKRPKKKVSYVKKNCDKYLGRGYSWFDVGRIMVTYIIGIHLGFSCSKHLICSEAVSRILYDASNKKLNLSKEYKKPYDLITPMDVFFSKQLEW